jgi:DegV family protein with EDD domain
MIVGFGKDEYFDGVNLTAQQFYEKLIESDELPKTSQITSYRFEKEYKRLTENGDEVVVIVISSKLSGTYESAKTAAQNFQGKVFVVDSLNACIGERLLGMYALQLIKDGLSGAEIKEKLDEAKGKINVMAMVNTLEYLKKGGRVSPAVAFAGELLSIKPVVAILDGEVKVIGKALGSKKGNNLLCSLVEKKGGINFDMPFGVISAGLDDSVLKKYVADRSKLWAAHTTDVPAYRIGSTIGTHVGPGAIGVAFFDKTV